MGEFVTLEIADGIGTIRLNRPPVNALNAQLTGELTEIAGQAATADEVRAVIIYGGQKCFAGGADITQMAEANYAAMAIRAGQLQAGVHVWNENRVRSAAYYVIGEEPAPRKVTCVRRAEDLIDRDGVRVTNKINPGKRQQISVEKGFHRGLQCRRPNP